MKGYLGIDIGTTNTKALLIGENGQSLWSAAESTPLHMVRGVCCFALDRLEKIVDAFVEGAKAYSEVAGVAFSSVGESVVPVRDGRKLHDPVVWYEPAVRQTEEEDKCLRSLLDFETTGLPYGVYYSIGKILWMRRQLEVQADAWLPLTTYMVWRKTGCTSWDYSQACRSYMYDIHNRQWIRPLLEAFSLEAPGTLLPTGSACGKADGIIYGLGGHDHITGMHALYDLMDGKPFFYDSLGTANVVATSLKTDRASLKRANVYEDQGGCVATGFSDGEYILTRSFRHCGRLLSTLMGYGGAKDPAAYRALNARICDQMCQKPEALFANHGDFILGFRGKDAINIIGLTPDTTFDDLLRSAYQYLSVTGALQYEDMLRVADGNAPYFAGGGIVKNELFMQVKATALNREITLLDITEIGCFAAALIAARACGNLALIQQMSQTCLRGRKIAPKPEWADCLQALKEQYRQLRGQLKTIQ